MCEQWMAGLRVALVRWYMRQAKLLPLVTLELYAGEVGKVAHSVMHWAMLE